MYVERQQIDIAHWTGQHKQYRTYKRSARATDSRVNIYRLEMNFVKKSI